MSGERQSKSYLAEIMAGIAVAVSMYALTGVISFSHEWGEAQADIDKMNRYGSEALIEHEKEQQLVNEDVHDALHLLDKRMQRNEIILEGIAEKLGVKTPPEVKTQ